MRRGTRTLLALAIGLAGTGAAMAEAPTGTLAPYQMVRSLQVLQDRIADGDHAALPMQNKLLGMIDERLARASASEFQDRRNFRAMLVYGMGGGNPATLAGLIKRLGLTQNDRQFAIGVLAYASGRMHNAQEALLPFDPMGLRPELGAYLALVQGSLIGADKPAEALAALDHARLLGPGTLAEEAALRRSLPLTVALHDPMRFGRVGEQYVRRFIRSPYASQFVDEYLAGVVALADKIDLDGLGNTIGLMTIDQQRFVYLKLARTSAINGLTALNLFAAKKAGELEADGDDPRADLYAALPTVASETIDEVVARLKTIDRNRLAPSDRELLEAAELVASSVTAPVTKIAPATDPSPETLTSSDAEPDAVEALVSDTRARLDAVDKMLSETKTP